MRYAYLLVSGYYSDYSVEYVFSTEEGAENYLKGLNKLQINHGLRMDHQELDPEVPSVEKAVADKIASGYRAYRVFLQKLPQIKVEEAEPYSVSDLLTYSQHTVGGFWGNLVARVLARSEEEAIELAKEALEKFIEECKANGCYHG